MRCKSVRIEGGRLWCTPDLSRLYNLGEAYADQPHISFLQMRTEEDLKRFTLRWGPLDGLEALDGRGKPLDWYWSVQGRLSALVKLMESIESRSGEREALEKSYVAEFKGKSELDERLKAIRLSVWPSIDDSSATAIIRTAELAEVRKAAAYIVRGTSVFLQAGFEIRGGNKVVAAWKLHSLIGALGWMVWCDQWHGQPVSYCQECAKVFRPDSKHPRKYCSTACAHRVASRNWARQKRKGV
jgi:hypothetical protein